MCRLNHKLTALAITLLVATLTPAKSSKVIMSWTTPAHVAGQRFQRVLALGMSDNVEIRADFEDAISQQLSATGVEVVPGHSILLRPEGSQIDLNYIKTQIREHKIDAVVVSRLLKVEKTVTYVSGTPYAVPYPYYNSFYGYYGAVYPVVYSPGYLKEEKKVRVETNLYTISPTDGELVWTGVTDTFNPSNVQKAINGLVKLVVKQMRSEGVL
jgi:hypothetical protein